MIASSFDHAAVWTIAAIATAGVVVRPWRWPEAVWAVLGAAALVVLGLLPWRDSLTAMAKGTDVYLFLIGMMALAEVARQEGLFDFLAAHAVRAARGSAPRLFALIYAVGTVVTVLMSNDATAVVLTPAVYAAAKAAKAEPLPYLFICAFIANAASFVLPISNPANLVIFREHMPPLLDWVARFGVPSILSIAATYAVLRLTQGTALRDAIAQEIAAAPLSHEGRITAVGIGFAAIIMLLASAFGFSLGLPTFLVGAATVVLLCFLKQEGPWPVVKDISWGVLPLVAGLFVLVEGLERTGVLKALSGALQDAAQASATETTWGVGVLVAIVCNLMNNLPAGLLAGAAVADANVPPQIAGAVLIGVDLGPNLSVTGSLATILWLVALRREGQDMGTLRFLKLGMLVMPPALILALGALVIFHPR